MDPNSKSDLQDYIRMESRLTTIESDLKNVSKNIEDIKNTINLQESKIASSEGNWRNAIEKLSDDLREELRQVTETFKDQLDATTKTFNDVTKEFVRRSEYNTLRTAIFTVVVAVFGQALIKLFIG